MGATYQLVNNKIKIISNMVFNNHRKTLSNFRLRYKGYSILKDQNKLGLWRELKECFLYKSPVEKNKKFSKFIFGSSIDNADLIIHQFCVDTFLPNWLGGEILENIASPTKTKITKPLPSLWVQVLENENFTVNKWSIKLKFTLFILRKFIHNVCFIFSVIYRSLERRSNRFNNEKTVFFCDLTAKNFPPNLNSDYNFDIFSWYIGSNIFNNKIQGIYHSVKEKEDVIYKNVGIKYHCSPTSYVNDNLSLLKFIIWSILATALSAFDLIRGKWHHALILEEAVKNKIVELRKFDELSNAYYFPYSSQCYRPMWTYGVSQKGIEIVSYFYSTFEQPKLKDRINNQKFEFYLYNWPIALVWNEAQSQLLKLNSKFIINEKVVGPIFDNDKFCEVEKVSSFTIALFDIQRQKKSFQFGTSTIFEYHEYNENCHILFIKDVLECAKSLNMVVHHKTKRGLSSVTLKSYSNYLNKIKLDLNYILADADISAIKLIDSADLIISSPFTSTAIYGRLRNKPSYYYDPTKWILKNDSAANDIPIISGIEELSQLLKTFAL